MIDRKTGRWTNVAKIPRRNKMKLNTEWSGAAISGDGTTVMVDVITRKLARVATVRRR